MLSRLREYAYARDHARIRVRHGQIRKRISRYIKTIFVVVLFLQWHLANYTLGERTIKDDSVKSYHIFNPFEMDLIVEVLDF